MVAVDARTSGEIFRKSYPNIIASNRHHATIVGARLKYLADGYKAGQLVARNTVSGLLEKYVNGAASGTGTAYGVLLFDVKDMPSGVNLAANVAVKAEVYESKVIDLDSTAKTQLGGRSVVHADGVTVFMF